MPQINRRLILFTLAFVNFTNIVDSMLIMPLGDIFIELFQINAQQFSFLVASYAIAASLSCILGIFYLDRFDRKKALLFAYMGFSIGTLMCGFASTYVMLLSIRFVTGLFGGLIGALVLSIVSDLYLFKERGSAMGVLFAAFSAASALGVPVGIYLAAEGEWQIPFFIIGIVGLLISAFIIFTFPKLDQHFESQSTDKSFRNTIATIFKDSNQVNALVSGFFLVLGHFMIIPFISPYLIKNVGLTQIEIAYQFFLGGLATVITSPIIGKMTDKYGVMKVLVVTMILSFIPTVLITNLKMVPLSIALSYTTLFFIFASGRMIAPNTIITAAAGLKNRGSFMSVKSALQQFAIAAASILSGFIVVINEFNQYENYEYVGYLAILIGILTLFLVAKIRVAKDN